MKLTLMRDCAREALKTYEDKKKILEEKENRGIKLGPFEKPRLWRDFCDAIEKAFLHCVRDSDYVNVGLAYMDYKETRGEYFKKGYFDIDLAHATFIKKVELEKTIKRLVGGNRTIRI